MEKASKIDINEEYEKLVPPTSRKSIFEDSEDYDSLRQYIIDQPRVVYLKKILPFSEVKITSYVEYKKQDVIDKEKDNGKHIFYLKQSRKGRTDFCDAAGYYVKQTRGFVVLPFSHIINEAQGYVPKGYGRKGKLDGANLYIPNALIFHSPEDAASFVLGQRAGMDEWIDSRGKGLLVYYKELAEPKPQPKTNLFDEEEIQVQQPQTPPLPQEKHVVFIRENGVCDASGYHDPATGHFYILKNSKIALRVDDEFAETPVGRARERLISSNCKAVAGYYIVQKDSKCRTATAAACYAMGKDVTYIEWETEDGKALKDFYPDRFFRKKTLFEKLAIFARKPAEPSPVAPPAPATPVEDGAAHMFYIKKNSEHNRECDAKGYYDRVTKKFIIMSGSTWSLEVTKSYQYTASEIMRRNIIKKNCKLLFGAFKQFKDVLCDSPSQAASYVLGRSANGWEEWIDKDGLSLKDIYKDLESK
jgi:hypothetical protein